jgi:hypothetical protein
MINSENRVKANIEKEQFRRTMESWAHSGFSPNRSQDRSSGYIAELQHSVVLSARKKQPKNPNDETDPLII